MERKFFTVDGVEIKKGMRLWCWRLDDDASVMSHIIDRIEIITDEYGDEYGLINGHLPHFWYSSEEAAYEAKKSWVDLVCKHQAKSCA